MGYSSRFFLYGPLVGLLILTALVSIHWWSVAGAWAERLDRANGHEIAPGVRISFSERRLAGFPFRLDAVLKNLRIEIAEVGGPIVWTTEEFAAHALSYGRVQMVLESAGKQTLSWKDARGVSHRFAFLPGTFRASALLRDRKLSRFDAEIVDLDGAEFRAANLQVHLRETDVWGLEVYLKIESARVKSGYAAALGPEFATLTLKGQINHLAHLNNLLYGEEAPEEDFENWRQSGGRIHVSELAIVRQSGKTGFAGDLSLNSTHNLTGTLSGRDGSALVFSGDRLALTLGLPRP